MLVVVISFQSKKLTLCAMVQRNSKTWGPKDELEQKSTWPNDRDSGNPQRAENGQKPGYGFRKDEAAPVRGSMGPPRAPPGGPPKEEAPHMRAGGGGAALPWEGGLFSMLADNVDVKGSRRGDTGQKEMEEKRDDKRRGEGAGGREERSPKRHRGDRERHATDEDMGAGPRGEKRKSARAGDRERGSEQHSQTDPNGDGRSQRPTREADRRGRDDRPSERAGEDSGKSSRRDSRDRRYSRHSPDRDQRGDGHGRGPREYDRRNGEEGSEKGRRDVPESLRRGRSTCG